MKVKTTFAGLLSVAVLPSSAAAQEKAQGTHKGSLGVSRLAVKSADGPHQRNRPTPTTSSVAGTDVHVVSLSMLLRKEHTATDPEFCEGFEILLVTASNRVFLPTFNAETVPSRRVRLDLYHKRGVHESRSMDANEAVRPQLFCHHRDRLAQQIGVRFPLQ
jgi:hypothetical protein